MNVMFFDTETTGLPKNWKLPMSVLDNWPRVIQLAWHKANLDQECLAKRNALIKPDGWTIPKDKFWIDNGFDTAKSMREGEPLKEVLDGFVQDLQTCDFLVSHNMDFDHKVLGAEMLRLGLNSAHKPIRICTKEVATDYCRIPFEGRRQYPGMPPQQYKWPKLAELHQKLFGRDFEGAHDAEADVLALKDCFFELIRIKIINL